MKGRILAIAFGLMCVAVNAFGGDGDWIVNGKLGVGTTTPTSKLHISGSVGAGGGLNLLRLDNTNTGVSKNTYLGNPNGIFFSDYSSFNWNDIGIWNTTSTGSIDFRLGNAGTVGLSITSTGNVSIGTPNPLTKLDVRGMLLVANPDFTTSTGTGLSVDFGASSGNTYSRIMTNVSGFGAYGNLVLGSGYGPNGDKVGIGTTTPRGTLDVNGTAYSEYGYWSGSDVRWKKNIAPLTNSLASVVRLQGKSYEWNQEAALPAAAADSAAIAQGLPERTTSKQFESGRQIGLIAQEVETVLPELVRTDEQGFKAIAYDKLTVVLIEAIKEQNATLKAQQSYIGALEERIKALESKIP